MASSKADGVGVVILAAGQGKRMRSHLPKVLHELGGQPLLFHTLDRVRTVLPHAPVALVVGHGRELVEAAIRGEPRLKDMHITFVHQAEQRGTGHAARCAMDSPWGTARVAAKAPVLILPGDSPLMTDDLIAQMSEPLGRNSGMRLLTCEVADPTGYGRVVRRGAKGPVLRIVEQKDANQREKALREAAFSIYSFQSAFLKVGLQKLSPKNAQGEYYLTDLIGQAARAKKGIDVVKWRTKTTFAELTTRGSSPWPVER